MTYATKLNLILATIHTLHQTFLIGSCCSVSFNLNSNTLHQSEIGSCWLTLHDNQNQENESKKVVSLIRLFVIQPHNIYFLNNFNRLL